jgi:hypothetical protein
LEGVKKREHLALLPHKNMYNPGYCVKIDAQVLPWIQSFSAGALVSHKFNASLRRMIRGFINLDGPRNEQAEEKKLNEIVREDVFRSAGLWAGVGPGNRVE